MVVLAVSYALAALVAVAAVVVVDADAAEGAAVVVDVAAIKDSGLLNKSPCMCRDFSYCNRHKRQIVVHRIKVK
ncbi:hypothetical protein SRABI96_04045 [Peribacillus sp. Bi96]|nr:hypothetical protein SRABI96_04045 [Peribacillus sp. Bi96]